MIYKEIHVHISPRHHNGEVEVSLLGKDSSGVSHTIHTQVLNSSVFLDNSSFTYGLEGLLIGKETEKREE